MTGKVNTNSSGRFQTVMSDEENIKSQKLFRAPS